MTHDQKPVFDQGFGHDAAHDAQSDDAHDGAG